VGTGKIQTKSIVVVRFRFELVTTGVSGEAKEGMINQFY
jgi:hypothetical protein